MHTRSVQPPPLDRYMLTLRQIEVIRAIMVTGTVGGAARLLNVSAPGVSRVMKHAKSVLGLKLFSRKGGRYAPTREAGDIFSQINGVYDKVGDLHYVVDRLKSGTDAELRIGSVPSLSNVMVPRAIADIRRRYPSLRIDFDVLKIEDAVDYLLLGKGEAEGVRGHVGLTVDAPIPAVQEFAKKFQAEFNEASDHNGMKGYIAPYMIKAAAEKAGKLDPEAIADALRGLTISPDKTPGILIEGTWDDTGEIDRISFRAGVKGGKQVITQTLPKLKQ